jgi:hypothetical protein
MTARIERDGGPPATQPLEAVLACGLPVCLHAAIGAAAYLPHAGDSVSSVQSAVHTKAQEEGLCAVARWLGA